MAKGPIAPDPMFVYNAIVRLGSARLDKLVNELKPMSERTICRLIRRLYDQDMIHRVGWEWFPCRNTISPSSPSSPSTQSRQVRQDHVVIIHSSENQDASREVNTTVKNWNPEGPVALAALSGAASATASVDGEPNMIEVMQFILTYVANLRSKHNQQEGMKKSRDKNYQYKGFTVRGKIEAMRDLVLSLSGAVAQNTLERDLSWISESMYLLIPDWNNPNCLNWARAKMREAREANMVAEIPAPAESTPEPANSVVDEPEDEDLERAWREASEDWDPTACGTYGYAPIVAQKAPAEIKVEIPEPAAVTAEEPLPFDPFEVAMPAAFEIPAPVEPTPEPAVDYSWIGKPSVDDEPYKPTVDCDNVFTRDVIVNPAGNYPDVPAIRAQHAADQQAARDAEHAANMARINQEMAAAALAEAQAAETTPAPVAPRILPLAEPVENAVVAAEPVVPAFPAETRQQLRVRVIAYLVGLPHRRFMLAAEIHAAIRPAMDVFDLDALLQYLGCNGEIEMSERGRREYEFCAHEPDEPLDAVGEPAVDSMAWLNEPYTCPDSTHTPSDDDDDVFSRPGESDVPVQESFESMKAKQQAARHAEHAAVIARINQEMAQEAAHTSKEAPCAYEHEEAPQAPAPGQEPAIHGLIREILKPGVAMPACKLAPLVGATPHELYDALTGMEPEVRNYVHAGVSFWERRAA